MKFALAAIACLLLIGAEPAQAAPRSVERYCFNKAQHVRPALRKYELEAFMANCIADHTPSTRAKRRSSKQRSY